MMWFKRAVLTITMPIIKLIGKMHLPFTKKKITGAFYYKYKDVLRPGDVILSTTFGQFSNLINPANWKHGAIYIGTQPDGVAYVLEALGAGVIKKDIVSHLLEKDEVMILRPNCLELPGIDWINERSAGIYEGMDYDYMFESGNKNMYCFELVVDCLTTAHPIYDFEANDEFLGYSYYGVGTLLDNRYFDIIVTTRVEKKKRARKPRKHRRNW